MNDELIITLLILTALAIAIPLVYLLVVFWPFSLYIMVVVGVAAGLAVLIPTFRHLLEEAHQRIP